MVLSIHEEVLQDLRGNKDQEHSWAGLDRPAREHSRTPA